MRRFVAVLTVSAATLSTAHAENYDGMKKVDGFWIAKTHEGYAHITKEDDIEVGRWEINCSMDKMIDKRKCAIFSGNGAPAFIYDVDRTPRFVCIRGHDFPGKTGMIRVDKHPAVATDPQGCVEATQIMPQILAGKVVLARWYQFPYDVSVDTETSLIGLPIAIKTVTEFQDNILD